MSIPGAIIHTEDSTSYAFVCGYLRECQSGSTYRQEAVLHPILAGYCSTPVQELWMEVGTGHSRIRLSHLLQMSEVRSMGEEVLVNVYQARDILKVSLRTIYHMMNDGRLKRGERNPSMVTRESLSAVQAQKAAKRVLKENGV